MSYIRLPLINAYNVRDLGGYATADGRVTAWRRYLRADALGRLTPREIDYLCEYGVRCVVDLRTEAEVSSRPDPFADHDEVAYHHLALAPELVVELDDVGTNPPRSLLRDLYVRMLDTERKRIGEIITRLADEPGTVLFHCAAGKDRTGIVAMLLLGAAGVRESEIAANYAASFEHLMDSAAMRAYTQQVAREVMESRPDTIRGAMEHLSLAYGGITSYLSACDVDDATLGRLVDRWCEPARDTLVRDSRAVAARS